MYPGRVGIYGKAGKKYTLGFRCYELRVTGCVLRVTTYGLRVAGYELRVANSKLLIGNIPFL